MARAKRYRFTNTTQHQVGHSRIDRAGVETSVNALPGEPVDLTADEIEATIAAYRPGKDPFVTQARKWIVDPDAEFNPDEEEPPKILVAPVVHLDPETGRVIKEVDAPYFQLDEGQGMPDVLREHLKRYPQPDAEEGSEADRIRAAAAKVGAAA